MSDTAFTKKYETVEFLFDEEWAQFQSTIEDATLRDDEVFDITVKNGFSGAGVSLTRAQAESLCATIQERIAEHDAWIAANATEQENQ